MPLPKYEDCEYSLFVSYAHDDDAVENRWIEKLRDAIKIRLRDFENKDIPQKDIHFSSQNGPTHGNLGSELEERVKKSFAMLLVVGKHYVQSGWCEKELEFFLKVFGEAGFASRLYIVAMTEPAITKAQTSAQAIWPKLVTDNQVWLPMYEATNHSEPMATGANPKTGFSDDFFNAVKKLTSPLIHAIESDWEVPLTDSPVDNTEEDNSNAKLPNRTNNSVWKIAIAPTTPELEEKALALTERLSEAGAECHQINKVVFECYDADDFSSGAALRNELSLATQLVVPFQDAAPLYGGVAPGGHIGILEREWLALKKQTRVVWFKPHDLPAPNIPPIAKHLEVFRKLSPLCQTPEAVVSEIFGRRKSKPITICIEKKTTGTLYEAMEQNILDVWENIVSQQGKTLMPSLKFRPFQLDEFDKNAAGFVLLFACGTTGAKELRDAIREIENTLEENSENYGVNFLIQGRVAVVLARDGDDHEAEKAPKDLWPTFKCRQVTDDRPPELDLSLGKESLEAFLNVLLKQHKKTELSELQA